METWNYRGPSDELLISRGPDPRRNVPFIIQEHGLDPDHDIKSALVRPWPCISQGNGVEVGSICDLNSIICPSYPDGIGTFAISQIKFALGVFDIHQNLHIRGVTGLRAGASIVSKAEMKW
jgi:hypothetical protein